MRVDGRSTDLDLVVEVRAGNTAGMPDIANHFTLDDQASATATPKASGSQRLFVYHHYLYFQVRHTYSTDSRKEARQLDFGYHLCECILKRGIWE